MTRLDLKTLLEIACVTLGITSAIVLIRYTIINSDPQDFRVFYYSAKAALYEGTIYDTYGPLNLPYWYFPWLAWFFIPMAFFPENIAYAGYVTISILCALFSVFFLANKLAPQTTTLYKIFALCMSFLLCWLLFRVGQMDFILLALAGLTIYLIEIQKPYFAGLSIPILLFKPHLFLLFLPSAVIKGGKKFLTSATLVVATLVTISFLFIPDWPSQMLRLLSVSGQRTDNNWNFTTLPTLLGFQENWSGTANLPFTIILILVAFAALWVIRSLETFPFLSLALAGSLFCAPRAYSYNFPPPDSRHDLD